MLHDMILAAGLSDIGCKRAANEDRILVDREQLHERHRAMAVILFQKPFRSLWLED